MDIDTFLTTLYVMVDAFCKQHLAPDSRPSPPAALERSEVLTLAILGQWQLFGSERGFYRSVQHHLRGAFPTLPARSQFQPPAAPVCGRVGGVFFVFGHAAPGTTLCL